MADTRRKKATAKKKTEKPEDVRRDLYLWLSLAVCVLLFLSNLGLGGPAGNYIGRFFFGLFGAVCYVLPPLLLFAIFFAVSNRGNIIARVKLVSAFLFVVFLDGIISVILYGKNQLSPGKAYLECFSSKGGGGMLGAMIAAPFEKGFGDVLSVILFLIFMIICLILITEKGFLSRFIDKKSDQRKQNGPQLKKKTLERRTAGARDGGELKRAEHKVSGINFTPLKSEGRKKNRKEGIREVTPADLEEAKKNAADRAADEVPEPEIREKVNLYSGEEIDTRIHVGGVSEVHRQELSSDPAVDPAKETAVAEPPVAEVSQDTAEIPVEEDQIVDEIPVEEDQTVAGIPVEDDQTADEVPVEEDQAVAEIPVEEDQTVDEIPAAEPEIADEPAVTENTCDHPYRFPDISLLSEVKQSSGADSEEYLRQTAEKLQVTLKNFGVDVTVTDVTCGPAVTRYELHPKLGVKVSKIVNLADDIKLNLAARDIRIEAPIPGKSAVGIEVPNRNIQTVPFREMVESKEFKESKSKIAFAAGKDIAGKVIISDIAKMPHLLIAGATGSGKSVCINTIIMSILYKATPEEVRFIMIDPKVVELSVYNGIPHLLIPVVTDPKKAAGALNWAVHEMDERYKKFANTGVRDIKGYNVRIKNGVIALKDGTEINEKPLPQIVVIVDELADLMMQSPKEVEESICRLAQLARACGIHLVIATQRPSVNVITGLIKANMPSRIAFAVTSGVDSRTILDMNGAEKLLGKGDMLYFPQGFVKPLRVQGAFVPDEDVSAVVDFLRKEDNGQTDDTDAINEFIENSSSADAVPISDAVGFDDGRDQYFADAGRLIIEKQKGSIGMLQRNFKIGFNRAARIMDQLEEAGVVGAEIGTKPRTVLMTTEQFEQMLAADGSQGDV